MRRRSGWPAAAIAVGLLRPAAADPIDLAQVEDVEDLDLSELLDQPVVAASRYEQAPGDSPTLVSTVDAEQIARLGYRSVGEALRGMRGVYLSSDRNYSYVGVRGFSVPGDYNTRIALSIDNHRINDPIYQQAAPGPELGLPMIAIDHIEMIRGGAWSVYGQSALLGAIQIVTATGASRPGLHVESTSRADAETFDDPAHRPSVGWRGQDVSASYGAVDGDVDVFAAASYLRDRGLPAIYTPELADPDETCVDEALQRASCDGVVRDADGEEAGSAYLVVRARRLAVHAFASRRWKRVPTASFETIVGDRGLETVDSRTYADAEYHVARDRSDVIARAAADYYHFTGDYPYQVDGSQRTAAVDRVIDHETGGGLWFSAELRGRYKLPHPTRWLTDVELAGGGEAGVSYATQRGDYLDADPAYLDRTDRVRLGALSAQASARVLHRVVGFAAVRGDYYPDSFGLTVNPQGGVVVDAGDGSRVRASYARGFRAPNPYERFFYLPPSDAPVLRPETSQTLELSYERYLGDHVRAQLVAYAQDMDALIALTTDDDGTTYFENKGWLDSHGVESEVEGRWGDVRLRASYTWQTASEASGALQANSPHSLAYVSLLAPIAGGRADAGVETSYVGERVSSGGVTVPAAFVTNLAITVHHVTDAIDLTAGAANLFDVRGGDPGSEDHRQGIIPRDPRTVWLRLTLEPGR